MPACGFLIETHTLAFVSLEAIMETFYDGFKTYTEGRSKPRSNISFEKWAACCISKRISTLVQGHRPYLKTENEMICKLYKILIRSRAIEFQDFEDRMKVLHPQERGKCLNSMALKQKMALTCSFELCHETSTALSAARSICLREEVLCPLHISMLNKLENWTSTNSRMRQEHRCNLGLENESTRFEAKRF